MTGMRISLGDSLCSRNSVRSCQIAHQMNSISELLCLDSAAWGKHSWLWNTCTVTNIAILAYIGLVVLAMQLYFLDSRILLLGHTVLVQRISVQSPICLSRKYGTGSMNKRTGFW